MISEEKKMEALQSLASHRGIMQIQITDFPLKANFADNIFPVHGVQYLLVFLDISCQLFPWYSHIMIYFEADWFTSAARNVRGVSEKFSDCMLNLLSNHVMFT
jgi:hypothetical protein